MGKKGSKQHAVDVNELIQRLIDAGLSSSPSSKATRNLCITNNEIIGICRAARSIFLSQPSLLELGTPVQVVGDIHGQYGDLMRVFQTCGMPRIPTICFLEIMSIGANNRSKPCCCYYASRFDILKMYFFSEEITNALVSPRFTAFMMNVNNELPLKFGRPLLTLLILFPLLLQLG